MDDPRLVMILWGMSCLVAFCLGCVYNESVLARRGEE